MKILAKATGEYKYNPSTPQVSDSIGMESYTALKEAGAKVDVKSFRGMGHEAWPEELEAVRTFILELLP